MDKLGKMLEQKCQHLQMANGTSSFIVYSGDCGVVCLEMWFTPVMSGCTPTRLKDITKVLWILQQTREVSLHGHGFMKNIDA